MAVRASRYAVTVGAEMPDGLSKGYRDIRDRGNGPGEGIAPDPGSASGNPSSSPDDKQGRLQSQLYGAAVLLVTTVLWASGGPTTKYLFLLPTPPSAALLTACISVITALFLIVGLLGSAMDGDLGASFKKPERQGSANGNAGADADEHEDSHQEERRHLLGHHHHADDQAKVEAEVEALLHSGVRAMGAHGGAGAAAVAAARWAAEEQRLACLAMSEADVRAHTEALARGASGGGARSAANGTANGTAPASSALSSLVVAALGRGNSDGGGGGGAGRMGAGAAARGAAVSQWDRDCEAAGPVGAVGQPSLDGICSPPRPARASPARTAAGSSNGHVADPFVLHVANGGGSPALYDTAAAAATTGTGKANGSPAVTAAAAHHHLHHHHAAGNAEPGSASLRSHLRCLTAPARSLVAAGLELGLYNTMAAALGAWGMQRISATRAAFLAQATSLITPLLVWLSGGRVGLVVWLACCCGALGGAMVALDNVYGSGGGGSEGPQENLPRLLLDGLVSEGATARQASGGDQPVLAGTPALAAGAAAGAAPALSPQTFGVIYVLLSCVFWGLGTVRLGVHSARFQSLQLAAAAAVSYASLAVGWLLVDGIVFPSTAVSDFMELGALLRNHVAAALLLWAGLGPGALSSYLQVVGQQTVPPAQAQVVFSSTPLWSALIAQLLLPGEAMGVLAWIGGAIMLGASLLASVLQ